MPNAIKAINAVKKVMNAINEAKQYHTNIISTLKENELETMLSKKMTSISALNIDLATHIEKQQHTKADNLLTKLEIEKDLAQSAANLLVHELKQEQYQDLLTAIHHIDIAIEEWEQAQLENWEDTRPNLPDFYQGRNHWAVPPTNNYGEAIETGYNYANQYLNFIAGAEHLGRAELARIVDDINLNDETPNIGYWVGFSLKLESFITHSLQSQSKAA